MYLDLTSHYIYRVRVIPLYEEGFIREVLTISSDITALKLTEKQLIEARDVAVIANKAKSDFLANMSHEIRTPLSSILGFGNLLVADRHEMSSKHADYCARIQSNGQHLHSIVNDVLDISKIEAGSVTLIEEPFDLQEVVSGLLDMFSVQASEKSIRLLDRTTPSEKILLIGDVQRLRQIMINLIGNALKFTECGEVQIDTKVAESTHDRKKVSITVSDTGCGIDPATAVFLFQPFEQGDISVSKKFGGTGLGLYLSRSLARVMGGEVVLESAALGKGCTFRVDLDFAVVLEN